MVNTLNAGSSSLALLACMTIMLIITNINARNTQALCVYSYSIFHDFFPFALVDSEFRQLRRNNPKNATIILFTITNPSYHSFHWFNLWVLTFFAIKFI